MFSIFECETAFLLALSASFFVRQHFGVSLHPAPEMSHRVTLQLPLSRSSQITTSSSAGFVGRVDLSVIGQKGPSDAGGDHTRGLVTPHERVPSGLATLYRTRFFGHTFALRRLA